MSMGFMPAEIKTISTRKRSRTVGGGGAGGSWATPNALSTRISRLAKKMKVNNPTHLIQQSLTVVFPTISTTGTLYDVGNPIAQGDDYNNRFGAKVLITHINIKGAFTPATATGPSVVRITILRLPTNSVFAANTSGSYSPIVTGTSLQTYYDKFYQVGAAPATVGYPTLINISKKIKFYQKYSGTGAGTATGESIFVIIQSNFAAGATAPLITGVIETFFQPM